MAPQDTDNQDQTDDQETESPGDAATGVGPMLLATRLRIGEDLRDVAKTLHIRFIYLQAIEDGRYDDLPGSAYALGFIRSYADYLGLDSEEVVRRFKNEGTTTQKESSELVFPVPIPESSVPGGAIVFIGFTLAILAYGGWYISTAKDGFLAELISPLPERLSALLPEEEKKETAPEKPVEAVTEPEAAPTAPEQPTEAASEPATEPAPEPAEQVVVEDTAPEAIKEPVEKVVDAVQKTAEPVAEAVVKPAVEPTKEVVVAEESTPQTDTPAPTAPVVETVQQPTAQLAEPTADFTQPAPDTPVATEALTQTTEAVTETAPVAPPVTAVSEPEPKPEPIPGPTTATMDDSPPTPTPTTAEAAAPVTEVAAKPAPKPQGRVYGVDDSQFRIEVKAIKNSWIQVRDDAANTLILTRLLRAGDSYRVPDRQGLKLLTGNAGALEILVDGNAVPPIGTSGAVRRSVALDPDRLVQGQAVE